MNIRKLIQEVIAQVMENDDVVDLALKDIGSQLDNHMQSVSDIVDTQKNDIEDTDNRLKSKLQLKSKLSPTSPERKGLEREIPDAQKEFDKRKEQLKDLEKARAGIQAAQAQIKKQQQQIQAQAAITQTIQGKKPNSGNVLPSLESPI